MNIQPDHKPAAVSIRRVKQAMSELGTSVSQRSLAMLREQRDTEQNPFLLRQLIGLCADDADEAKVFLKNGGLSVCWDLIQAERSKDQEGADRLGGVVIDSTEYLALHLISTCKTYDVMGP